MALLSPLQICSLTLIYCTLCFISCRSPSSVAAALVAAFSRQVPPNAMAWPQCGNLEAAHISSFAAMAAIVNPQPPLTMQDVQNAQNAIQGSLATYYADLLQSFTTNLANSFIDTVPGLNLPVRFPSAITFHPYLSSPTNHYYFIVVAFYSPTRKKFHCHILFLLTIFTEYLNR